MHACMHTQIHGFRLLTFRHPQVLRKSSALVRPRGFLTLTLTSLASPCETLNSPFLSFRSLPVQLKLPGSGRLPAPDRTGRFCHWRVSRHTNLLLLQKHDRNTSGLMPYLAFRLSKFMTCDLQIAELRSDSSLLRPCFHGIAILTSTVASSPFRRPGFLTSSLDSTRLDSTRLDVSEISHLISSHLISSHLISSMLMPRHIRRSNSDLRRTLGS
jgi:hypothetical protein